MDVVIEPRMRSVNGKRVPHSMLIPSREMIERKIEAIPRGGTELLARSARRWHASSGRMPAAR